MKIVIDIPDNEYCTIKEMNLTLHTEMLKGSMKDWENANAILNLLESVKSGVVLPKGHGDLIDRNALEIEIKSQIIYCDDRAIHQSDLAEQLRYMNTSYGLKLSHNIIEFAPTMIDADKENEDDKSSN